MPILKTISPYKYRFIYGALLLLLVILVRVSLWYLPLLIAFFYFIHIQHRDMFKLLVVIAALFLLRMGSQELIYPIEKTEFTMVVSGVKKTDYSYQLIGRTGLKKIIVYSKEELNIGDVIRVSGELNNISNPTIPNGFDYKNYLKSNRVAGVLFAEEIDVINHRFHINHIKQTLEQYIHLKMPQSARYVKTFILADTSDFDEQAEHAITLLGISHLFAVSGMHIGLLVMLVGYGLKKVQVEEWKQQVIIVVILLFYMMITGFSPSVVRASMMVILLFLNKRLEVPFSSLDILAVVFMMLLFFHPNYYLNIGFQLSFLVTFSLIISYDIIRRFSGLIKLMMTSLIAFLITVPLITTLNYEVNLMTVFVNLIFIPLTSLIIVPLGYITFILPFFDLFYAMIVAFFDTLIILLSQIFYLPLAIYFNHPLEFIMYYGLLYRLVIIRQCKRQRVYLTFGLFLFLLLIKPHIYPLQHVTFLDLSGESTVITDRFDQCNIVIDTGNTDDYNTLINYLQSRQISRIDYLFISHFHSDHAGELSDLIDIGSVNHLISPTNANLYANKLIPCGNIMMYLYHMTDEYSNPNNNSLPISVWISNRHYFFMGDAEEEAELAFTERYQIDVDILKVSHHGSNTSSSIGFITSITPKQAIINVDRNNTHGHPDIKIIERYRHFSIPLFRTDQQGTIDHRSLFGVWMKKDYPP